ncbi:hypothetical protein [Pandoraea sp. ISTKB]|uniref:hypothetical protein n=1 Tax=Pandoraea sp. ISTKB TaxID=1586708 RepID=UPI00147DCC11|nr:hypothetical protein [Pandoraea sp. ISTKB]
MARALTYRALQGSLDGACGPRNVLPDAVDSIAAREGKQRTDHQEKRHETRQHIDLDTKMLQKVMILGLPAVDAPSAGSRMLLIDTSRRAEPCRTP